MRAFEELVDEAARADVSGWDWDWLEGRATEERPPWGYARLMAGRLGLAASALDVDTGGGEVVAEAPVLPARMLALEGWPPNAARARALLGPRGVDVHEHEPGSPWPVADADVDLVTSRHPVAPQWGEIARVLRPGGRYLAQHVGPRSAFELIEHFLGPMPEAGWARDPGRETAAAEAAGLRVESVREARLRMTFLDVGAVVWTLRRCVWWVPDFTPERYERRLREMDAGMRAGRPFVAHSTRHLIEAVRPLG